MLFACKIAAKQWRNLPFLMNICRKTSPLPADLQAHSGGEVSSGRARNVAWPQFGWWYASVGGETLHYLITTLCHIKCNNTIIYHVTTLYQCTLSNAMVNLIYFPKYHSNKSYVSCRWQKSTSPVHRSPVSWIRWWCSNETPRTTADWEIQKLRWGDLPSHGCRNWMGKCHRKPLTIWRCPFRHGATQKTSSSISRWGFSMK